MSNLEILLVQIFLLCVTGILVWMSARYKRQAEMAANRAQLWAMEAGDNADRAERARVQVAGEGRPVVSGATFGGEAQDEVHQEGRIVNPGEPILLPVQHIRATDETLANRGWVKRRTDR